MDFVLRLKTVCSDDLKEALKTLPQSDWLENIFDYLLGREKTHTELEIWIGREWTWFKNIKQFCLNFDDLQQALTYLPLKDIGSKNVYVHML